MGLFGTVAAGRVLARAAPAPDRSSLFCASIGSRLLSYRVDPARGALSELGGALTLPAEVQFAWQHPARPILYVATSDQNTAKKDQHHLSAVRLGPDGSLALIGNPVALASRPIHVTIDHQGKHVLTAYNRPSAITVHRIAANGDVGPLVAQRASLDTRTYAHQVRVFPDDRAVLLMARGNDASGAVPEDPGTMLVFDYADGQLGNAQAVAPDGGRNFRPRHADFDPSGRWLYVDLESQNVVQTYALRGDRLSPEPLFAASTLDSVARPMPGQLASAIKVHPDGRALYVANRSGTETVNGERLSNGGQHTVAVFAIDRVTGEPRKIQSVEAHGVHVRTMDISPDGRWLVAAPIAAALEQQGGETREIPAGLSLFRIEADRRLTFVSKHAIDLHGETLFWSGATRV